METKTTRSNVALAAEFATIMLAFALHVSAKAEVLTDTSLNISTRSWAIVQVSALNAFTPFGIRYVSTNQMADHEKLIAGKTTSVLKVLEFYGLGAARRTVEHHIREIGIPEAKKSIR
jgi:hypothetical protein